MLNGGSIHVEIKDAHGNTMLAVACQNGNKRVVKLLIRKGANLNSKNVSALLSLCSFALNDIMTALPPAPVPACAS